MSHFPRAALAFGCASIASLPAAAQTFAHDVDPAASLFSFGGTTNVGPIVGQPPTFRLDGAIDLALTYACGAAPTTGRFAGGDAVTVPATLAAMVPNPIPIFPPLASLTIHDLHLVATSPPFSIGPTGAFATEITLTVASGSVDFVPLIGSPGSLDLAGFATDPTAIAGTLVVLAGETRLVAPVATQIPFDEPSAGISGTVDLNGTISARAPLAASFCDGSDGSLGACPCMNPGFAHTGCDLPQGTGGVNLRLLAQSTSPLNSATFAGCGFPAAQTPTALLLRSTALDPAAPVVFGDGLRCLGTPLVRLTPAFAAAGTSVHVTGHGPVAGSGSFYYQIWFRSTPITYCDAAAAFSLSSGAVADW